MRKCVVVGCKTGYLTCSENVPIFLIPKDKNLIRLWQIATLRDNIKLKAGGGVSHHHFNPDDILYEKLTYAPDGVTILERVHRIKMWSTTSGFALTLLHFWLLDFVVKTGSSGCEEHLVARRGVIQTPNFPGAFSVPIGCRWIIDASEIPSKNGSIIVYLTQLYVYTGLTFTEYAYYESETSNFGASLLKEITEANVFQFRWFKTYRPFLVIEFQLDRLEGHHVRVLDNLLDVYGFNITYEMTEDEANPNSCTAKDCSFSGNCYLDADFTSFSCTCFDNFSGANCAFGALCKKNQQDLVCRNGGSCRHVGAAAVRCHCATGYTGNVCEIPPTRSQDSECEGENCILQCPYPSENRKPCQCKESTKIYHDRSRYECRIKLSNVTSLRASLVVQHSTIESLLSRQVSEI